MPMRKTHQTFKYFLYAYAQLGVACCQMKTVDSPQDSFQDTGCWNGSYMSKWEGGIADQEDI